MTDWKAVAIENGISLSTFHSRISRDGWSPERAATTIPKKVRRNSSKWLEEAKKNGINYYTFYSRVKEYGWSEERAATTSAELDEEEKILKGWIETGRQNGITYANFWNRVNRLGWSHEDAAIVPLNPAREYEPRTDQKFIELAKSNGINYHTYIDRVDNRFMDPYEAATTPAMSKKEALELALKARKEYEEIRHDRINNDPDNLFQITPQHIETAKENGIPKATVHSRVYISGWTVEDATTKPQQETVRDIEGYDEYLQIAKKNKIKVDTFISRIKRGWTLHDAANKPVIRGRTKYKEENVETAEQNGISYSTFKARMLHGWNIEDAKTIPPLPRGAFHNEERKENVLSGFKRFTDVKRKR